MFPFSLHICVKQLIPQSLSTFYKAWQDYNGILSAHLHEFSSNISQETQHYPEQNRLKQHSRHQTLIPFGHNSSQYYPKYSLQQHICSTLPVIALCRSDSLMIIQPNQCSPYDNDFHPLICCLFLLFCDCCYRHWVIFSSVTNLIGYGFELFQTWVSLVIHKNLRKAPL